MESRIARLFLHQWQRKLVAIFSAFVLWLFVNSSIIETKTLPNVPIRIINLPLDKTIVGLLPNRLLSKRVTLTLSGTKDVIQELEPGDLEVLLDLSNADSDEWVVHIGKKNLVSLTPSIDLVHHITQVSHPEFVLKLSPLFSAKIPVKIMPPVGEAPAGFEFLDVWPQKLVQVVTGPQEEVQALKARGLELTFNLSEISKADLDALVSSHNVQTDEVSFVIPDRWKRVTIPFHTHLYEELNDPEAQYLRIDFLKKGYHAIGSQLPIRVYYPLKFSDLINPITHPLKINDLVRKEGSLTVFTPHLYVANVSTLFLEIIKNYIEIVVVAAPKTEREFLPWSIEVIDPHELESLYVAFLMADNPKGTQLHHKRENVLRERFHKYMKNLNLYTSPEHKLRLEGTLGADQIEVNLVR